MRNPLPWLETPTPPTETRRFDENNNIVDFNSICHNMFINPSVMIESGQQEINYPIHQDIRYSGKQAQQPQTLASNRNLPSRLIQSTLLGLRWLIFLLILLKMRNSNNRHFLHFKNSIRLVENGEMSNRAN